jgi:hypothetical protein
MVASLELFATKFFKSQRFHFDFICTGFRAPGLSELRSSPSANSLLTLKKGGAVHCLAHSSQVITVLCKFSNPIIVSNLVRARTLCSRIPHLTHLQECSRVIEFRMLAGYSVQRQLEATFPHWNVQVFFAESTIRISMTKWRSMDSIPQRP